MFLVREQLSKLTMMNWIIATISLAQAAQAHVPEMGGAHAPLHRSTVKSFFERSSVQVKSFPEHSTTKEVTTGDGRDDLLEVSDAEGDLVLLPPVLPNLRRKLRVKQITTDSDSDGEAAPTEDLEAGDDTDEADDSETSEDGEEDEEELLPDGRPVFCEHGQPGHNHDIHHSGICAEPKDPDADTSEEDHGDHEHGDDEEHNHDHDEDGEEEHEHGDEEHDHDEDGDHDHDEDEDGDEQDDGTDGEDPNDGSLEVSATLEEIQAAYDEEYGDEYADSPAAGPGSFDEYGFPAGASDSYLLEYEAPGPVADFEVLLRANIPSSEDILPSPTTFDTEEDEDHGHHEHDHGDNEAASVELTVDSEELGMSTEDDAEAPAPEPVEVVEEPSKEPATEPVVELAEAPAEELTQAVDQGNLENSGGFTESGDLTYYGGAKENGACSQTYVPAGFTTVAINKPQWADGKECGTCVEGCFTNEFDGGERCFKAIVDNLCPECLEGDLDMGEDNGGRWDLEWKFIDCPAAPLQISTQGGNKWYAKIKIQGGPSSVSSLTCDYANKTVEGAYTDDGFFEFWDRTEDTFTCSGMTCEVTFSRGGGDTLQITPADLGNKC